MKIIVIISNISQMVFANQSSLLFARLKTVNYRAQNNKNKFKASNNLHKRSGTLDPLDSKHRRNSSSTDSFNMTLINSSRPLQEENKTEYKYLDVWKRAMIKIRAQVVLKKLLKSKYPLSFDKDYESPYKIQKSSRMFSNLNEKKRDRIPCYILHPKSKLKMAWNVIILVLVLYTITVMPFSMSFLQEASWGAWEIIDIVLTISFFFDFLVNLLTAYYDDSGKLITSLIKIAINYLKSWMLIDIVSFFPFFLISFPDQSNTLTRFLIFPKLYHLIKALKLPSLLNSFSNKNFIERLLLFITIKNSLIRLYQSLFTIFIFLHIAACLWHLSAKIESFNTRTWVFRYNYQDTDIGSRYLISIYWAFTTLCTVGYGDIVAQTNIEKVISIIWMSCGLYFFSFTIGRLSSLLSSIDSNEKILNNKLEVIDEFSEESGLSVELRARIKQALIYSANSRGFSWLDKLSIINELPKQLRYEVAMSMHHGAAKSIKLLKNSRDQNIISFIVPLLQPMLLEKEEFLYKTGECADEIYFVVRGRVSYAFGPEHIPFFAVQKGSYFGDIEVIRKINRKYSTKAVRNSELLVMNREVLRHVESNFLDFWEEIKVKAEGQEKNFEKIIIEIQEIMKLKNSGELDNINVKTFKKYIEDLYEAQVNTVGVPESFTLDDLSNRLEKLGQLLKPVMRPEAKKFTFSEREMKVYLNK